MIPIGDSVTPRNWPVATWTLIAVNVWVFLYQLQLGPALEAFVRAWGFVPARYFVLAELDPGNWVARFLPLLTSMFLHGGWGHLVGNMIYLYIFGDSVEDRLGHLRYLVVYLLAGAGAGLAHAHLHPDSAIPTIGASGAISGVLGGYLVLFPHAQVYTFIPLLFLLFPVVQIPAAVYLGFWFAMQLVSGTLAFAVAGEAGGVAWWAHVGGFVAGVVLVPLLRRRQRSPPPRLAYASR